MSVRKRNEFLDGDESDDGVEDGYDSEEAERRKGTGTSGSRKRRKLDEDSGEEELTAEEEEADAKVEDTDGDITGQSQASHGDSRFSTLNGDFAGGSDDNDDDDDDMRSESDERDTSSKVKLKLSTPKQVVNAAKAARKSGVVYLSRIPPFMKPHTLRHYLEPHARKGLGRTFLTPEDDASRTTRVKRGGNKKRSFVDGWVEFKSKKEAKLAAQTLNGNIIGGKKGGFYHDDIWNMNYLKGFKWSHLTEQIANENAERAARMREEIRRTRKENKAFVDSVERSKMLKGMEEKGQIKAGKEERTREFKQKKSRTDAEREASSKESADLRRVLGKIF